MGALEQERETLVQMLLGLQTGCDEKYARQILQKHDWNADQAAAALLDVATNEQQKKADACSQRQIDEWLSPGALNAVNPPPARPNSVIDLTGDDDEDTAKAIVASMETQPTFGPSNRIDDTQQWAMVPSNAPPALTQEDHALNRALEASLSSSLVGVAQEPYEEPLDAVERARKNGWPTALRITDSTYCYMPVVLQCLLSLPKVHERLLNYSLDFRGSEDQHAIASQLQRLAAIMTHTARAYVAIDDLLDATDMPPPISNQDPLPGLIRDSYGILANQLEFTPCNPKEWSGIPLMEFQGGNTDADINASSSSYASGSYMDIFMPSPFGNDVVSCLTHSFSKSDVCLTQLSQCLAFVVRRQDDISQVGAERMPLKYPSRIFLDRFLQENTEKASELWGCQEGMQHEIQKLIADRQKLSNWKNEDTVKALQSSIHYFEHLVSDGGDPKRREAHEQSKLKLLDVVKQIEVKVKQLDDRIKELTIDAEELFNKPDLQQHGYDLYAVIMHDGLLGRNHVYSYTKDQKGNWWKIVDYQITEVSEEMVLNDQTGLHLGAGPLLLLYSRVDPTTQKSQEESQLRWPRFLRDLVLQDNAVFLTELPPEIAASLTDTQDMFGISDDPIMTDPPEARSTTLSEDEGEA